MDCLEIQAMLPAYVKDETSPLVVRRHLADCPDCSEELARYTRLLDVLGALQWATVQSPPVAAAALAAAPFEASPSKKLRIHVAHNRAAYLSGLAVSGASAAGAAVWLLRNRRMAAA
ncbi:MAG: zf-HC2 domain-containing protein [Actinobacteria bacterium]|jgi:predicted anti-sigma-YlaC factor YlaD|nr:zf-HC2 domain-containing protein [Actinomycetota bacterium]